MKTAKEIRTEMALRNVEAAIALRSAAGHYNCSCWDMTEDALVTLAQHGYYIEQISPRNVIVSWDR